jgi:hypothetical protein
MKISMKRLGTLHLQSVEYNDTMLIEASYGMMHKLAGEKTGLKNPPTWVICALAAIPYKPDVRVAKKMVFEAHEAATYMPYTEKTDG